MLLNISHRVFQALVDIYDIQWVLKEKIIFIMWTEFKNTLTSIGIYSLSTSCTYLLCD